MHVENCFRPGISPGPILLAVNPFKRLSGMYTEDVLLTYFEQVRRGGGGTKDMNVLGAGPAKGRGRERRRMEGRMDACVCMTYARELEVVGGARAYGGARAGTSSELGQGRVDSPSPPSIPPFPPSLPPP